MWEERPTKRLFYFLAGGHEAEVDKCGDTNTWDGIPAEHVDELERQGKEVEPYGAMIGMLVEAAFMDKKADAYCLEERLRDC
jgi:hypothetical protein